MPTSIFATLLMIGAAILPVTASSAGDLSACQRLMDADARNYCRAKVKGDRAICATIVDADKRAQCQAEV